MQVTKTDGHIASCNLFFLSFSVSVVCHWGKIDIRRKRNALLHCSFMFRPYPLPTPHPFFPQATTLLLN